VVAGAPAAVRVPPAYGGVLVWATVLATAAAIYAAGLVSGQAGVLLAGGLLLAVPLAFAWRLEAGVLLLILIRPSLDVFADRNLASVHGVKLNPADVLGVLTITLAVPYMIERRHDLRRAPAILPYLLFAAIALVGIPLNPGGSSPTEWLRLCAVLVMYPLVFLAATGRRQVARILAAIIASAAVPAAVGIGQWATGGTSSIGDLNRATGTFLQPDPYGIYLALITVAALALVFAASGVWRWLALSVMLLAGTALVLSYTRTGWVMVAVGAIVLGLVRYRVLLVIVPVVALAGLLLVPGVRSRVHSVNQSQEVTYSTGNSFDSRVAFWRADLPMAGEKPLTGLGLGSIVQESDTGSHVHSDYIRALVETGVFGFLAYVWLLLAALIGCLAALRWSSRTRSVSLVAASVAGIAAAACYLLASGDSNLMTQSSVSGSAWALIACAHAAGRVARSEALPQPVAAPLRARLLGPGLRAAAGPPT
jgi:O-antigen ligase